MTGVNLKTLRMKRLILITLVFSLLAGCSKSKDKTIPNILQGKWTYYQYYMSTGGLPAYYPATPQGQWVDFQADGSVSSTMDLFKTINRYEILDSVKVRFFTPPNESELFGYYIDTVAGTMNLYSLDHICIEGCGVVVKK
jgi:hypothetical protein